MLIVYLVALPIIIQNVILKPPLLFSNAHRTFSRINYTLDHKASLKFKRTDIMQNMFSDHKGIKLDVKTENKKERKGNL